MVDTSETIAELPDGGILYEPRSLWDVKAFELTDKPQVQRMDREHFCNEQPYPIQIERITVCPINYAFKVTPQNAVGVVWQSMSAVFNAMRLFVSSPFRFHLGLSPIRAGTLCPYPTETPTDPTAYASGSYGLTAMNFRRRVLGDDKRVRGMVKHMILPQYGSIVWDLSAANRYTSNVPLDVSATMVWEEGGGLWPGSARSFGPVAIQELGTDYPAGLVPPNTEEGWPYILDAFAPPVQAGSLDFWQPQTSFTQQKFVQQEATRQGSTVITGMRVHLDQSAMDDDINQDLGPLAVRVAPASTRIGCRVQSTGGGTNRDWWRPGAPICLVLDSITPALVYELEVPFTLGPGDTLDIGLEIPAVAGLPQDPLKKMFQVGVAFNGWAAVEG